ncbi:MAG: protein translocase subunit SecF [Candidatus Doudnabacteria bacterium]|nr:protein translocase subunit SecF [Candidatus Doudnabacteria bacterium]
MFNTLKYCKLWLVISGLILAFGLFSLLFYGLRLGIDFTGGSLLEIKFKQNFDQNRVKTALNLMGLEGHSLQTSENFGLIIKTKPLSKNEYDSVISELRSKVGELEESKFESIGPVIGKELRLKALYQLGFVSLGILLYIGYAFRRVAKPVSPWKFGLAAIIALFHDLLFMLGFFSLLGKFKGMEIDSMFVTAVLTVLGFSVHDTIVVFDRIRENLKIYAGQGIEFIINHSIAQTIVRSLNTSLTVLFVLLALLLFGGATTQNFVLALFVGIMVGTYSSIFIASPMLLLLQKQKK